MASALDIGFGYDPTQGSTLIDTVRGSAIPRLYVSTNGGFTYTRQMMFEKFSLRWEAGLRG